MIEIYKGLDKLSPRFQQKVNLWLNQVGDKIFITESSRNASRQAQLYAQGRTLPGKIVTWVTHSSHQDGLAVDIAFQGNNPYPNDLTPRRQVADIAKQYGIDWGYDLWQTDKPHFQDNGKDLDINPNKMSKFDTEFNDEITLGYNPLFKTHDGDESLSEKDIKQLCEIIAARLERRIKDYIDTKLSNIKKAI